MPEPQDAFVSLDAHPAPSGLETGHHDLGRGVRLRYVIGRGPAEMTSRGTVLLLQGRNETVEKYYETVADLNARGFTVASFDWRGQGGSGRETALAGVGHVGGVSRYAGDLERFLREVVMDRCPPPYAVLAHSMGGLVALSATERLSPLVERMVLVAPLVALPGRPGATRLLGALAALLHGCGLGFVPLRRARRAEPPAPPADNVLTSDAARFARNRALQRAAPWLFVEGVSASWLRAVLRAMRRLDDSARIARLDLPTLFLLPGDDRVVSTPAAERLAWRMRAGHSIRVAGARHELLQEADRFREPALAAIEAFLAEAMPPPPPLPAIDETLIGAAVAAAEPPAAAPPGTGDAPLSR
ncbi:alpha/beta hydrolase [Aureimonas flava]|uniref:Alpha/beta hydrolase n=1 Tax=Aureimonas flava TaxID=2320271 RepID=A0A3A1WW19_9HYPH|nr:alpha/beta hydrolase [Aureimonas flava]RIY02558.1 alpha/beta hydrolase [Aureimonas flava]